MSQEQPNNPMHGIKLKDVLSFLIEEIGWDEMAENVDINCFKSNPTMNSSLKFLRKELWARNKVEALYLKIKNKKNK